MARWIGVAGFGGAGAASYLSSAATFLALVVCVLAVVTVVAALCAKNSRKEGKSKNPYTTTAATTTTTGGGGGGGGEGGGRSDGPMDSPPRSSGNFKLPPMSPRAIINTISSKKLLLGRKGGRNEEDEMKPHDRALMEEGGFLWQKGILMGERCQPPDFSGVIIYDNMGNRLPEFPPRSPKISHLHSSLQANATLVR